MHSVSGREVTGSSRAPDDGRKCEEDGGTVVTARKIDFAGRGNDCSFAGSVHADRAVRQVDERNGSAVGGKVRMDGRGKDGMMDIFITSKHSRPNAASRRIGCRGGVQ